MQAQYVRNPVTPVEILVTGALALTGVAGLVGGLLVTRKAVSPYHSGPPREFIGGPALTPGTQLQGAGAFIVRTVSAYRGFAYVTIEATEEVVASPDDPLDWSFQRGMFIAGVQLAPSLIVVEPSPPDAWDPVGYASEPEAVAAARGYIDANYTKLMQVVRAADPLSVAVNLGL